ncbi:ABC transporter permease subunit [Protaetiibacter intestinalis]|uniref:ABC transporter permease n=1 Tax=Protaetiibacter intestinalis TaxID=2419774 RepID=A0A387B9J1_9MICO|nr:ABC transporter permease subunit [Protaetiibacter intestinalis]AYF97599.1 ABC transporter permease [Protaetiibacter intestinalis]
MSATTATRFGSGIRPTLARGIRSEWIKLRSLRSTVWIAAATVLVMAAFAALFAWAITVIPDEAPAGAAVLVVGYPIAQLVIGVLGTLVITGEYATGGIRSTLAAEPRRMLVVAGKAIVVLLSSFAVSLVALGVSAAVALPILNAGGVETTFGADDLRALVGVVLYLTLSGWFAFGIGLLVKHTAAAITALVGVLFILPIVVQIISATTGAEWLWDVYQYLPAPAGSAVVSGDVIGMGGLEPWTGFAVFGGYTAALLAAGTFVFSRRDD